jgi:hypothetical protein
MRGVIRPASGRLNSPRAGMVGRRSRAPASPSTGRASSQNTTRRVSLGVQKARSAGRSRELLLGPAGQRDSRPWTSSRRKRLP